MPDIHWTRRGTSDLAAVCLDHPQHWDAINAAEQDISDRLQRDPLQYSQEVSEGAAAGRLFHHCRQPD